LNDNFPEKLDTTISAKAIIFENATTFKYSNHGYAVLGAVIEKVSGMPYCEYVIEKVITPLGLKNTLPDLPKVIPVQLVHGYERWTPDMTERKREPHIPTNAYASATGFISDVKDLAVFLAALHPDTKKSVLSRESRKAMRQIHGIINDEEMYGLGLSLETTSGEQTYGHSGGFAGFITNAISHITDNVQVIVLTNTNSSTAPVVSDNIMRLIYTLKKMKDVTYLATEPYSGTYRNRWGDVTVVSLGKDLIEFSAGTPNPVKNWSLLKKLKQHTFKNTDESGFGSPGETLTFTQIKKGTAQILTSDGMELSRIR
jgi:CubicO group peptidase (beta-lactamase class C family)